MGRFISRTRGRDPKLSKVIESSTIQDSDSASPTGPIGEKLTHAIVALVVMVASFAFEKN
jgi:hypothetical protein